MSAKFNEFPSLPFQDIKEKPKRQGRMDAHGWTTWKQYTPHKHSLRVGIKMAKFKTLLFCQEVFSWHQTSSCKCSMCLHCVYKVSGCFSKSCGTSWISRICATCTYAPLRITKGSNSNRIGPSPHIFIINIHLIDINAYAKFDEFPSLPSQDIK